MQFQPDAKKIYTPLAALCLFFSGQFFIAPPCFADAATAPCDYANVGTLPIVYFFNRPYVRGTINKQPVNLMVSTESNTPSLSVEGAKKLNLPLQNLGKINVGLTGVSPKYKTAINELKFGPILMGPTSVKVYRRGDPTADGTLGTSALFTYDVEIDPKEETIKFFDPTKPCSTAFLAYWDKNASSVELNANTSGRYFVSVEINGKKINAILGTSKPTTLLNLKTAEHLFGITPSSQGVTQSRLLQGSGKHQIQSWVAPFDTFTIGAETLKNPHIVIADLKAGAKKDGLSSFDGDDVEMILGSDFFNSHRVLFAISQEKMYFTYIGGEVFTDGTTMKNTSP